MPVAAVSARDALAAAAERLASAGCDTPRLDAELLLADALGRDRGALLVHADDPLPADAAAAFAQRIGRRAEREPVAYILGRRGFRRIELAVDRRVLIPRPARVSAKSPLRGQHCRLGPFVEAGFVEALGFVGGA